MAYVIGCDFSEPTLDLAGEKAAGGVAGVRFEWADALELPYDSGRFDAVTVGFGVRNFADCDRGLRAGPGPAARRPPRDPGVHPAAPAAVLDLLLDLVRSIVPILGRITDDPEAYSYLAESVRSFPGPPGWRR